MKFSRLCSTYILYIKINSISPWNKPPISLKKLYIYILYIRNLTYLCTHTHTHKIYSSKLCVNFCFWVSWMIICKLAFVLTKSARFLHMIWYMIRCMIYIYIYIYAMHMCAFISIHTINLCRQIIIYVCICVLWVLYIYVCISCMRMKTLLCSVREIQY